MKSLLVQKSAPARQVREERRVYLAVEWMRQQGLETGDWVIVRRLATPSVPLPTAVGIAWPLLTLDGNEVQLSSLIRTNARLRVGDLATVERYSRSKSDTTILDQIELRPTAPLEEQPNEMFALYAKEHLVQLGVVVLGETIELLYKGLPRKFIVHFMSVASEQESTSVIRMVDKTTRVRILAKEEEEKEEKSSQATASDAYKDIGGLDEQVNTIRELIETPLFRPELYEQYGVKPPRGVLLYGPPGTGKTLIARSVAMATGAHFVCINGPEIISKFYGETETRLRNLFHEAADHSPAIIFIDEIDALAPKRDQATSETEKRVVTTLLTLMDGPTTTNTKDINKNKWVVIGATNRPNALDDALRRPGRFDREIEIGIPNAEARFGILTALLRETPHKATVEELRKLAAITHGYVGADLAAVCREAGLKAIQRTIHQGNDEQSLVIQLNDLESAVAETRPSAMREITVEVPTVRWIDIGGQDDIKQKLKESVEWPLQHPEAFLRLGIQPPKGILLYGPPGCSKTLMAKALATESGLNFMAVKGPELFSKWVGESEKAVRDLFKRARAASPSIIFFDEIDALTVKRGSDSTASVADRVLSQLLNELDGIEPLLNVTVVAATNRPDIMDSALLRPGRIDRILYVGPPDQMTRTAILERQLTRMPCATDVIVAELAEWTEGCSGAEVVALCQEAAFIAMEEDINATYIHRHHFKQANEGLVRRITPDMIDFYDRFRQQSGLRDL
ncbi:P-loop containing nucleoside triphosphate hydrolase protein [Syncephalis plumigaleata]|nr:P-loop containing nucleoside triphosphate hydrolase protein [Syncephalis plumigaleata]